jgi:biopolymer transport protein ExbB
LVEASNGSSSLGDGQRSHKSTLHRLCVISLEETRRRTMAGRPLSGEGIESIRASLDAEQVRIGQELNGQMVLLTIAISGGPFLGLLGTVVGVMITFAAIAADGDVNVNAIAPGIAAALVATVAGLAVAIPSLFGYNWLLTRVKSVIATQQVFVDELVTKLAEAFSQHEVGRRSAHPLVQPPPPPSDA